MLDNSVLDLNRVCVNGLCGCGKSSGLFEILSPNTTSKSPVLFVYQTYKLMLEQIETWANRYDVDRSDFIVCGHTGNVNQSALNAYSNPTFPDVVPDGKRFVFYSQSYLQKCKHNSLTLENGVNFGRIVVDEFDYTKSIIPTFDYQFNTFMDGDLVKDNEKTFYKWLKKNYSINDVNRLRYANFNHQDGFTLAHWLQSSQIPVMFLTSEELSVKLLQAIGFDVVHHGVKEMKNCVINLESCNYINDFFFSKMNIDKIWAKFDYDLIISNKIDSFYQTSTEVLERPKAIPHITAKGSNDYRGLKVLTIISHVPNKAIKIIKDVFGYYGINMSFDETKALYYKAILLQSVGRVLGYRGSVETDVLIHSSIWDVIKNNVDLPYSVNDKWSLEFEDKKDVINYVNVSKERLEHRKKFINQIAVSYGSLKKYFVKKEGNIIPVADLKQYLKQNLILNKSKTGSLTATKVAKFFDVECKQLRYKNKVQRCVVGLDYKTEV